MQNYVKQTLELKKRVINEIGENFSDASKMKFIIELGKLIEKTEKNEKEKLQKLIEMVEDKKELSKEDFEKIESETGLTEEEVREKICK